MLKGFKAAMKMASRRLIRMRTMRGITGEALYVTETIRAMIKSLRYLKT